MHVDSGESTQGREKRGRERTGTNRETKEKGNRQAGACANEKEKSIWMCMSDQGGKKRE